MKKINYYQESHAKENNSGDRHTTTTRDLSCEVLPLHDITLM